MKNLVLAGYRVGLAVVLYINVAFVDCNALTKGLSAIGCGFAMCAAVSILESHSRGRRTR